MRIGLLGHGTIGVGADRIIKEREDMEVVKILSLVVDDEMAGRTAASAEEIMEDPSIDTVVEVMGGIHPAFEYIKAALEHKKNVVTANKAVVAACYDDILALAEQNGVSFRCTAAVGGSIPWLVNIERARRVNELTAVGGIMNGTTNFILHKMLTEKAEFDEVLKEAQDLGYAEKDPSADIDGDDIRRKLLISANMAFGISLPEDDVQTFGIRNARLKDCEWGADQGLTLKLAGFSEKREDGSVSAYVAPVFLGKEDVLSAIPANYNLVRYTGTYCGTQSFIGEGAGRFPTAHNVVEDLIDILETPETFYTMKRTACPVSNESVLLSWYIRTAEESLIPESFGAEACRGAFVTARVSVKEMLDWAVKSLEKDNKLFIAAIG